MPYKVKMKEMLTNSFIKWEVEKMEQELDRLTFCHIAPSMEKQEWMERVTNRGLDKKDI